MRDAAGEREERRAAAREPARAHGAARLAHQSAGKSVTAVTRPGEYSRWAIVVPASNTGFHSICCETTSAYHSPNSRGSRRTAAPARAVKARPPALIAPKALSR